MTARPFFRVRLICCNLCASKFLQFRHFVLSTRPLGRYAENREIGKIRLKLVNFPYGLTAGPSTCNKFPWLRINDRFTRIGQIATREHIISVWAQQQYYHIYWTSVSSYSGSVSEADVSPASRRLLRCEQRSRKGCNYPSDLKRVSLGFPNASERVERRSVILGILHVPDPARPSNGIIFRNRRLAVQDFVEKVVVAKATYRNFPIDIQLRGDLVFDVANVDSSLPIGFNLFFYMLLRLLAFSDIICTRWEGLKMERIDLLGFLWVISKQWCCYIVHTEKHLEIR